MPPNSLLFIVDDDEFIHRLIKLGLRNLPIERIDHFYSGEECLKNIHKSPGIILIDYEMEGLNGIDTIKKINDPSIRIFMISGSKDKFVEKEAIRNGAEGFFLKDNSLIHKLNSIFNSKNVPLI
ncbi:MAG: response regulator [Bacteroidales bacterium]|nr:response regulator [Bacteroidales bacterium]